MKTTLNPTATRDFCDTDTMETLNYYEEYVTCGNSSFQELLLDCHSFA